jgi:hypothetical protein
MTRRGLLVGLAVALMMAFGVVAYAAWTATGHGPSTVGARTMPAGNTPTTSVSGRDVTVSWTASSFTGGPAVSGYAITRYPAAGGSAVAVGSNCSGTIAALTCTELAVTPGSWKYTVTPIQGAWHGTESAKSTTVVVGSPTLTLSVSAVRAGHSLTGSVAHFDDGETVTFHLGSAGGTSIGGPATVSSTSGSNGTASATLTIPGGTTDGTYTVYAVASPSGDQATATLLVDNTAPATTDNTGSIGSGWKNTTQTVTLTATDPVVNGVHSGVAATYYTTDGSTPTTSSSSGTSISLATDGVYTIKYFSIDNAGNTEAVETAATAIHIDKTNPSPGTFTLPSFIKNGQALTNAATDPTVSGASSGVASVSYYYCSGTCTPSPGAGGTTLIGTSTTGPSYSVTWTSQPADGSYSVLAQVTDNAGNKATSSVASTTVENTAPVPSSLSISNGGTAAGLPEKGDQVVITFNETLADSSICSSWTGTGDQSDSANNDVTVSITGATGVNNKLTISTGSTCGTFNFGSIDLGTNGYVANGSVATFSGTGSNASSIAWTSSTHTLTITLGRKNNSTTVNTVTSSTTATYTPSTGLQSASGTAMSASATVSNSAEHF